MINKWADTVCEKPWIITMKSQQGNVCCFNAVCSVGNKVTQENPLAHTHIKVPSYLHLCPEHGRCCWGRASVVRGPVSPNTHSCPIKSGRWFGPGLLHGRLSACFPPKLCLWSRDHWNHWNHREISGTFRKGIMLVMWLIFQLWLFVCFQTPVLLHPLCPSCNSTNTAKEADNHV